MKTSELFQREIEFIKNEHLRNIVANTLDASPECIQTISASSSKRYHPEYSIVEGYIDEKNDIVVEGGLAKHIKATVGFAYAMIEASILEGLLKAESSVPYTDEVEDIVYASLILHDCCKPDDTPKHSTRFDHPLEGAKLFNNVAMDYVQNNKDNIDEDDMDYLRDVIVDIYTYIKSHMGKYTTAPYAKGIVLPKPVDVLGWFIHTCDLLSSRKYLNFDFDKYYKAVK